MASRRMISADIFEDEYFIELSMLGRVLWFGLVARCADDQGRLQDNIRLIKSQIFPADDIELSQLEALLVKFSRSGKIIRYKTDGKNLIQIANWWKYQTPMWAGKSKFPAPDGWIDREKYHAPNGAKIVTLNWDKKGGYQVFTPIDTNPDNNLDTNPDSSHINDVNGEVNVNGEGEGDFESPDENEIPETTYKPLEVAFCKATGKHPRIGGGQPTHKWVAAFLEMQKMGATPDDVNQAVLEMVDKNYTIAAPSSIVTWVSNSITKRTVKARGDPDDPDNRRRYFEGPYADFINH